MQGELAKVCIHTRSAWKVDDHVHNLLSPSICGFPHHLLDACNLKRLRPKCPVTQKLMDDQVSKRLSGYSSFLA
jgi:hypothetical protein